MVNSKRITEEFCRLVSIDSPSFHEGEMAAYLKKKMKSLGFSVYEDQAKDFYQSESGNLYCSKEGTVEGEPLLFCVHMDTVEPARGKRAIVHRNGKITSAGDTVLGADDLAGVAAILEALEEIKEYKLPHREMEIVFTFAEEPYLQGSRHLEYSRIKSRQAYIWDLSGEVGTAALRAPSLFSFEIRLKGRASHAGFSPEEGVHAIVMAAEGIKKIRLGKIGEEMTVNIGLIEGGLATNIVPENCVLKGEVRSLDHEKGISEMNRIKKAFEEVAGQMGGSAEFISDCCFEAYRTKKESPVVQRFVTVCDKLGISPQFVDTFGGSDLNNFSKHGIVGIVGACAMNQVHSCGEYTQTDELVKIAEITRELMTSVD